MINAGAKRIWNREEKIRAFGHKQRACDCVSAFTHNDGQQGRANTLLQVSERIASRLVDACTVARFGCRELAVILQGAFLLGG